MLLGCVLCAFVLFVFDIARMLRLLICGIVFTCVIYRVCDSAYVCVRSV